MRVEENQKGKGEGFLKSRVAQSTAPALTLLVVGAIKRHEVAARAWVGAPQRHCQWVNGSARVEV